ncbi:LOW QUALITY PROTEIN: hypothetical protein V2J09_011112 [Rumex salicifolius]
MGIVFLTASTIPLTLLYGSLQSKISDPMNTPSHPSCIISAASAGVTIPPLAKCTTGSRPICFVCATRSYGAPIRFAKVKTSSSSMLFKILMSPIILLTFPTVSTTSPIEDRSPWLLIIAAPSRIRRSASPRSRHPQRKGTRKLCLLMK